MKEAGIAGLFGNAVDNICFDVILRGLKIWKLGEHF